MEQKKLPYQPDFEFMKPSLLVDIVKEYELSHNELKTYNFLVRKLMTLPLHQYKTNEIHTNCKEIATAIGLPNNRKFVIDFLKRLRETTVDIRINTIGTKGHNETILESIGLIRKFTRPNGLEVTEKNINDWLVITFEDSLTTEILKRFRFAQLDLIEMKNLKSSTSIIFYELFVNHIGTWPEKFLTMTENEIRERTNTKEKYKPFKDFNSKIIKTNINKINKETSLLITYDKRKTKKSDINNWSYDYPKRKINEGDYLFTFKIVQEQKYQFNLWRNSLKKMVENGKEIYFKHKNKEHYIFKLMEDRNPKYRLCYFVKNDILPRTTESSTAIKIWETEFEEFKNDFSEWLKKMDINLEDFESSYLTVEIENKSQVTEQDIKEQQDQNKAIQEG